MITAAIHGTTVAPSAPRQADSLAALASEIAARVSEMNELRESSGTDLVLRLASIARLDRGAFAVVVAVLHGNTSVLTDSYSERGDAVGRKKQTVHYRTIKQIENITSAFPEVAAMLSELRLSVKHHEDPISREQVIRDAAEM